MLVMSLEEMKALAGSAGLIIFITGFVLVMIYVFLPSNSKAFDHASRLPLEKDPDENSPRG
jgi:cbb3-type cytochrome oxidase subunit 3